MKKTTIALLLVVLVTLISVSCTTADDVVSDDTNVVDPDNVRWELIPHGTHPNYNGHRLRTPEGLLVAIPRDLGDNSEAKILVCDDTTCVVQVNTSDSEVVYIFSERGLCTYLYSPEDPTAE